MSNNGTVTATDGSFRIYGLEPGEYVVGVIAPDGFAVTAAELRDRTVDALLASLKTVGPARTAEAGDSDLKPISTVWSRQFYPDTPDVNLAVRVALRPGQTADAVDVTWRGAAASAVVGRVLQSDGAGAAEASVRLTPFGDISLSVPSAPEFRFSSTTRADGSFEISHVPQGVYRVTASVRRRTTGAPTAEEWWASDRIAVIGERTDGLTLSLRETVSIEGQIMGLGAGEPPSGSLTAALLPRGTNPPTRWIGGTLGVAAVSPDGRFLLSGLRRGEEYELFVNGLPNGVSVEGAKLGSTELVDGPLVILDHVENEPLIVRTTESGSGLSGSLSGQSLLSSTAVVVFPADKSLWASSWRVRVTYPDASGAYSFQGLLAGDYLVGAVVDVDPEEWRLPFFLEQLAGAAVPVSLGRAEQRRLDLKAK